MKELLSRKKSELLTLEEVIELEEFGSTPTSKKEIQR